MEEHLANNSVEGLLLKYRHFYGSYDYIGDSRRWYRREVRIIRNDKKIRSFKDAQGFRKNGKKLQVKLVDAYMHHYGWVRHPAQQHAKVKNFNKYWHDDVYIDHHYEKLNEFDYAEINSLEKYRGTHPEIMQGRIARMNWEFNFDPSRNTYSMKERLSNWVEKISGIRPGEYRNYILLK